MDALVHCGILWGNRGNFSRLGLEEAGHGKYVLSPFLLVPLYFPAAMS